MIKYKLLTIKASGVAIWVHCSHDEVLQWLAEKIQEAIDARQLCFYSEIDINAGPRWLEIGGEMPETDVSGWDLLWFSLGLLGDNGWEPFQIDGEDKVHLRYRYDDGQ